MLGKVVSALVGAIVGAIIGGVATWHVSRRLAFLERCHRQIELACEELQLYRVAYAQYYVEYLSKYARAEGRDWANVTGERPDMDRLELERQVDDARGRLRVHGAILRRVLSEQAGVKAGEAISLVLRESSHASQTDCRVIDKQCDTAMETLLTALPRT